MNMVQFQLNPVRLFIFRDARSIGLLSVSRQLAAIYLMNDARAESLNASRIFNRESLIRGSFDHLKKLLSWIMFGLSYGLPGIL